MSELEQLLVEIGTWSVTTFPHANAKSKAKHLVKEAMELEDDPSDLLEHADCLFLLAGIWKKEGITFDQLKEAIRKKLEINKARTWGPPGEDGVSYHVEKSGEQKVVLQ